MTMFGLKRKMISELYYLRTSVFGLRSMSSESPKNSGFGLKQLPDRVDWKEKGAVGPILKQRGNCCFAFATVAVLEALHLIATGIFKKLSEQQIVDCVERLKCGGSYPDKVLEFIIKNGGLALDEAYPFTGEIGKCRHVDEKFGSIDDYGMVQPGDELGLMRVLTCHPVLVFVDSKNPDFVHYKGGIYEGRNETERINHALALTGYGKTEAGEPYFEAKNSWGPEWGEGGFIRFKRFMKIQEGCSSLADRAMYPIKHGVKTPFLCPYQPRIIHAPCCCKRCAPKGVIV